MFIRFVFTLLLLHHQVGTLRETIVDRAVFDSSSSDTDVYLDNFIQHVEALTIQQWSISLWVKARSTQPGGSNRILLQLIDRQDNRSLLDLSLTKPGINHELAISKDKNSSIAVCSGVTFTNAALVNDFDKRLISDLNSWSFLVLGFDIDTTSLPASSFSLMKNTVEECNQTPLYNILKKDLLLKLKAQSDVTVLIFNMNIHDSYIGFGGVTDKFVYGEATISGLYKFHLYPQYLDRLFNLLNNEAKGLVYNNLMPQTSTYYFNPSKTNTWFTRNLSIYETHICVPQEHFKSSPIDNSYIFTVDFDLIVRGFNLNNDIDNLILNYTDPYRYIFFLRALSTFTGLTELNTSYFRFTTEFFYDPSKNHTYSHIVWKLGTIMNRMDLLFTAPYENSSLVKSQFILKVTDRLDMATSTHIKTATFSLLANSYSHVLDISDQTFFDNDILAMVQILDEKDLFELTIFEVSFLNGDIYTTADDGSGNDIYSANGINFLCENKPNVTRHMPDNVDSLILTSCSNDDYSPSPCPSVKMIS